jgi:hypothetical protein
LLTFLMPFVLVSCEVPATTPPPQGGELLTGGDELFPVASITGWDFVTGGVGAPTDELIETFEAQTPGSASSIAEHGDEFAVAMEPSLAVTVALLAAGLLIGVVWPRRCIPLP